jgi:lysyl endopeptidase
VCTTWRAGPDNRMFTNNHCISTASSTASAEVWFNYQLSTCGGSGTTPTKVAGDQMLATNTTLDYTLFTVKNFANISSFGYLGLETRAATQNEEIFIAGHPGGRQKELSIVSDRDGGGRCRINSASTNGYGTNSDIGYYCDTEGGSSGSPVIARASNKAIALHHLGGGLNKGAKISLIWPQVATFFGNVPPGGDNGSTPPPSGQTYTNGTDFAINDNATVNSPITVSGRTGNGSATTPVAVNIVHTYKGDLKVDLVAPDGSVYVLHNRSGGSTDNINQTYTVNLSSEALNGTWGLRVNDNANVDTGRIDTWNLTF